MKTRRGIVRCLAFALLSVAAAAQDRPAPPPAPTAAGFLMVTGYYKDAGVQREYTRAVTPVLKEHGYRRAITGVGGSNLRIIEGDWLPGSMLFLIEFPSAADLKAFWWSSAYQAVKQIRATASNLDVVALDGMPGATPLMNQESAYLVFVADIIDFQRFANDYGKYAPDVVRAHGGQFLVREGRAQMGLLEGDYPPGSVIVVEFPDTAHLRAFWDSAEYRRLSEIRRKTGKWSVAEITPRPATKTGG